MGNVQLHDGAGSLKIAVHQGFQREFLDFFAVVNAHIGSCGAALARTQRVVVEDVVTSPIFRGTPALTMMLKADARSCYSTPIVVGGSIKGMISVHRRVPWKPCPDELIQIDHYSSEAAAVLAQS